MTRDLTKKPLDVGAMVDKGSVRWREYNARLVTVEKFAASAAGDPRMLATLAKLTVRAVRDERRLLRRYLRARFGISLTGSFPRIRMRIVNRERARPKTLTGAVRSYDLMTGYMVLDLALWAMRRTAKEAYLAQQVDEVVRSWWAAKYAVLQPHRQTVATSEAVISAYVHVMRNAPIAHTSLASVSEGARGRSVSRRRRPAF